MSYEFVILAQLVYLPFTREYHNLEKEEALSLID